MAKFEFKLYVLDKNTLTIRMRKDFFPKQYSKVDISTPVYHNDTFSVCSDKYKLKEMAESILNERIKRLEDNLNEYKKRKISVPRS